MPDASQPLSKDAVCFQKVRSCWPVGPHVQRLARAEPAFRRTHRVTRSSQKQIGTPAQLREPARTPLLYSLPGTQLNRKIPESAKREEGGENAAVILWGGRSMDALTMSEQAGPDGPKSHKVASPRGYLEIHTSGPPNCQADIYSN